ncbi:hypothetical protein SOCE26_053570 [Sorangium cellulosum]|uniref:DUF2914 domain-containing protein n=1 Tax=Sorangium cellulosum TaxID=56 RepID=A0A2L0EX74_SORCE|nr:DUF2914 domain-containing protein [Sorangium cellulosum]AUX43901.1 hypothetical protein SOCE26_053570 [Sorangium cellulosum]
MVLALAAALGGAALVSTLGCGDPREAVARIAREEPPALSRAAQARPGAGPEGPASAAAPGSPKGGTPSIAAAAGGDAAEEGSGDTGRLEEGSTSPSARGAARGRRRRSGSAAEEGAGRAVQGAGAEERDAAAPGLQVMRLVVSRGISGREPLEPATSFASAEIDRLYAFVELSNKPRAASEITVTFTPPDGRAPLLIRLPVGAERRFRTWAATRKARAAGVWAVTVGDAAGNELARTSFTITT